MNANAQRSMGNIRAAEILHNLLALPYLHGLNSINLQNAQTKQESLLDEAV